MSTALAEVPVVTPTYEEVVERALDAFATDLHYLEDMVRVAQRVMAKKALRERSQTLSSC